MCYKGSDFISKEKEKSVIFKKMVNIFIKSHSWLMLVKT